MISNEIARDCLDTPSRQAGHDGPAAWQRLKTAAGTSSLVRAAALGQLCSLLLAVVGSCSESLSRQGVFLPTFQSLFLYALLAAAYGGRLLLVGRQRPREQLRKYAALALLDLEGNFLLNKAYRYTSITSVTLLDCFSIPGVLLLSWLLLGAHYKRLHFGGAAVCVVGLAVLVVTDGAAADASQPEYPHAFLGDALVLVGASLYALCNVSQEALLCDVSNTELLACIGVFGFAFSAAQLAVTERSALAAAPWDLRMAGPLVGYVAALVVFYSLVPFVLRMGGAALLNLSLLSSDLWAAAARVAFFGGFSGTAAVAFLAALSLVSGGLILFSYAGEVYAVAAQATGAGQAQDVEAASKAAHRKAEDAARQHEELQSLWAGPDSGARSEDDF